MSFFTRNFIRLNYKRFPEVLKIKIFQSRSYATNGNEKCSDPNTGLVLGVWEKADGSEGAAGVMTPAGWRYNKHVTKGRLYDLLRASGPVPKLGEARIFFNVGPHFVAIAICGLGRECLGYCTHEVIDQGKEAIRRASAAGCNALQKINTAKILVENFGHAESAAEGAAMSIWVFQEFKNKQNQILIPPLDMYVEQGQDCDWNGWRIGLQKASAQNLARRLQEMPSNMLTPTLFAQNVVQALCKSGVNVEVKVKGWAENQNMNALLAVSKGSCEQPIFLELSYYGADRKEQPIVLIGQGVTYDAGGLCLKDRKELKDMRGDMAGAASVVAACRAIASLKIPVNIRALIPLCENVIGCNSYKPGDIVFAMNGKSVEITRTDYEDALVLIDALVYAQTFSPKCIVGVGTTSKTIRDVFDEATTGVFTNSECLWQKIKNASIHTGDRVWRMPLWKHFSHQMTSSKNADIRNVGAGTGGETCQTAALLRAFVPCGEWLHIDARSVLTTNGTNFEYLRKGMAGRPTRTLIEFIAQTTCSIEEDVKKCDVVQ